MKLMKLIFLGILLICNSLSAQRAFDGFTYQAVVRTNEGIPFNSKEVDIQIDLIQGNNSNTLYSEEHTMTTNQFGQINLIIGTGTPTKGSFSHINWSEDEIYYRVQIQNNKEQLDIISEAQILAVPYAFHAQTASRVTDLGSRSSRNITEGKFWSLIGNIVPDDTNKLGTLNNKDLNIITNDVTRLLIRADGSTQFTNNVFVNQDFEVEGLTTLRSGLVSQASTTLNGVTRIANNQPLEATGSLSVGGLTHLRSNLTVEGASTFNGSSDFNGPTNFNGPSAFNNGLDVKGPTRLDGTLEVTGASVFEDNVRINKSVQVDQRLDVGDQVLARKGLQVLENVNIGQNTEMQGNLDVYGASEFDGEALFKSKTVFDIDVDGLQTDQASYPVLIKGSKQGLAIDLDPATNNPLKSHRGNNYISFWRDGLQKGRIEGMGKADLDPTGMVSLFTSLIQNPPQAFIDGGVNFDYIDEIQLPELDDLIMIDEGSLPSLSGGSVGSLPSLTFGCPVTPANCTNGAEDAGWVWSRGSLPVIPTLTPGSLPSIDFAEIDEWVGFIPFDEITNASNYQTFADIVNDFSSVEADPTSPAGTIWAYIKAGLENFYPDNKEDATNFESQIFSNYTLDILTSGISAVKELYSFSSSFSSILDPGDIITEASDLIVEVTNLLIYGGYADINLGVAYESGAGDYAEWLERAFTDELIHPGDVVGVKGGLISKSFTDADKFMVVSTAPLLLGNMPTEDQEANFEKIAFMGQVPVKVLGEVKIGDYILPSGSDDGLAIAVSPDQMLAKDYKRIVGVAWSKNEPGAFVTWINTAIGINQNDMANVVERMQSTLNNIQTSLAKLDPQFEANMFDVSDQPTMVSKDITTSPMYDDITAYFDHKEYGDRKEMLADVKKVLKERSNIDVRQFPLVNYLFENPDKAQEIANIYKPILADMNRTKAALTQN